MKNKITLLLTGFITFTSQFHNAYGTSVNDLLPGNLDVNPVGKVLYNQLSPPVNDEPCGAISLACNGPSEIGNFNFATISDEILNDGCGSMSNPPGGDVWFRFESDGLSTYIINTDRYNNAVIALFVGDDCSNLTQVEPCTDSPEFFAGQYPAGTYYFSIRPFSGYSGFNYYEVNLYCVDGIPANDEVCGATEMVCGEEYNGTFVNATKTMEDDCQGNGKADLWFYFEADGETNIIIDGAGQNYIASLYTAASCTNELLELEQCSSYFTYFNDVYEPGIYYFRIRPKNKADFAYHIEMDCLPRAVNDSPCDAIPITCDTENIFGSTFSATPDSMCGISQVPLPGVWYQYTAATSGTLRLNTCKPGTDIGSRLSVFTGTCDDLQCLHYDFGTFECGYTADLTFNVDQGSTYYILLSGYATPDYQNYQMNISCDSVYYDCPDLHKNIGEPCSDNNSYTINDQVMEDCTCQGTFQCDEPYIPVYNMQADITDERVIFRWNPVMGSTVCLHQLLDTESGFKLFQHLQFAYEPDSIKVPLYMFFPDASFTWKIKCACSLDPVIAGQWNSLSFVFPGGIIFNSNPNPVSENANVSFSLPQSGMVRLEVYDLQGTKLADVFSGVVAQKEVVNIDFDTSHLVPGIYFYRLTHQGKVTVSRFTVAR